MITCIIIDNNPISLKAIEEQIASIPFLKLLKSFENSFEALNFLNTQQVDLLFTEIDMPSVNGWQLLNSLSKKPMTIVVSGSEKYAMEGFNVGVIDYVVKPISFDRLLRAVNKAYEYHNMYLEKAAPAKEKQIEQESQGMKYIFVKSDYKTIRISLDDILLIEGLKDYVKIHTLEKSVLSLLSLKNIENRLPVDKFIRVHRSYIVSFNKIDSIEKSRIKIDKYYIPISELYKDAFVKNIQAHSL